MRVTLLAGAAGADGGHALADRLIFILTSSVVTAGTRSAPCGVLGLEATWLLEVFLKILKAARVTGGALVVHVSSHSSAKSHSLSGPPEMYIVSHRFFLTSRTRQCPAEVAY